MIQMIRSSEKFTFVLKTLMFRWETFIHSRNISRLWEIYFCFQNFYIPQRNLHSFTKLLHPTEKKPQNFCVPWEIYIHSQNVSVPPQNVQFLRPPKQYIIFSQLILFQSTIISILLCHNASWFCGCCVLFAYDYQNCGDEM